MSNVDPFKKLEGRPVLAGYASYSEAQAAVDKLSDSKFPVQNVAIVGVDLRLVEAVVGRLSWGRAALSGLGMGAWFGLLLGLFVSLFARGDGSTFSLVLLGLMYGAAFGIVFGLISYAFTGGKRDFLSRSQITAGRYDLHCDAAVIGQARQILGLDVMATPSAPEPPTDQ
ncbi:MAG: general stress protein [Candidatus Nanopelagicales bacterium]